MGCQFLFRGLFLDQGLNSGLLHWQASDLLTTETLGKPSEQSRQVERQAAALLVSEQLGCRGDAVPPPHPGGSMGQFWAPPPACIWVTPGRTTCTLVFRGPNLT